MKRRRPIPPLAAGTTMTMDKRGERGGELPDSGLHAQKRMGAPARRLEARSHEQTLISGVVPTRPAHPHYSLMILAKVLFHVGENERGCIPKSIGTTKTKTKKMIDHRRLYE